MLIIRNAELEDINAISAIHAQSIPHSINSMIGLKHLNNIYSMFFLSSKHDLIVAENNGLVVGFISGTADYALLMKCAKGSISLTKILKIVHKMGPLNLFRMIFDRIIFDFKFNNLNDFYYLSTWGVELDTNPIAATLLFRELLKRANLSHKHLYIANVDSKNQKLIRMYKSLGFNTVGRSLNETIFSLKTVD